MISLVLNNFSKSKIYMYRNNHMPNLGGDKNIYTYQSVYDLATFSGHGPAHVTCSCREFVPQLALANKINYTLYKNLHVPVCKKKKSY